MKLISFTTLLTYFRPGAKPAPTVPPPSETALPQIAGPRTEAAPLAKSTPEPMLLPPASVREQLVAKCRFLGREIARKTRAYKQDGVLKGLEEQALALAISETLPTWEPEKNVFDARLQVQLARHDTDLEDAEADCKIAAAHARLRQEELAKLGSAEPRPTASATLCGAAVIGITLSLSPTIHDLLTGMFPLLRWLIAIGFGAAFALFIVAAILPDNQPHN